MLPWFSPYPGPLHPFDPLLDDIKDYSKAPQNFMAPDTGTFFPVYPSLRPCLPDERPPCPLCSHRSSLWARSDLVRSIINDGLAEAWPGDDPLPVEIARDWAFRSVSPWPCEMC